MQPQQTQEHHKRTREEFLHDKIESAKLDIDRGVSFKAVSRKYEIPIELCRELKDKTTGRFFFDPWKEKRHLVAERVNPISGQSNAPRFEGQPINVKFYRSAKEAFADKAPHR